MTSTATFFLSTGRCGTQWLAAALDDVYGDALHVAHEPVQDPALMRRMRGRDPKDGLPEGAPGLRRHFDHIDDVLSKQSYVETGFPLWSALPHVLARWPEQTRIVHLVRDSLPTAQSWAARGVYAPTILPHETPRTFLTPFDPGVCFPEYRDRWDRLSPLEKNLYFWAEVHAFALDLKADTSVPWLHVRVPDLFDGTALPALCEFLGVEARSSLEAWTERRVDQFAAAGTRPPVDDALLDRHPRVQDVAKRLADCGPSGDGT